MRSIKALYRWLTCRPSYMFMTAGDERLDAQEPARFTYVWLGLMGLSVLSGLVFVGVWTVIWRTFSDWDRLSRPAAVTAIVLLGWPLRRAMASIGSAFGMRDKGNQYALASVCAVLVGVGFMSLVERYPHDHAMPEWIAWIACIRPELSIFRVLLLMPVWGAWSMLITTQFHRPDAQTDQITRRCAQGCGPLTAVLCILLPLLGSLMYFHYMVEPGCWIVTGATVVTAIFSGPILCRLGGGLTRRTLLASNMITQIVFLMLCTVWL